MRNERPSRGSGGKRSGGGNGGLAALLGGLLTPSISTETPNAPASSGDEVAMLNDDLESETGYEDGATPAADEGYKTATTKPLTTLKVSEKPGFWRNLLTRGEAGQQWSSLNTQVQMQNAQNQFLAEQAAKGDMAALERLREAQRLEDASRIANDDRLRTQAEGDFQVGQNDTQLALMQAGQSPLPRYTSRGAAESAFGANRLRDTGFVPAFAGLVPTAQQSQISQLENAARLSYAQQNPAVLQESAGAGYRAPIQALDLGERRMKLGEQGMGLDERRFDASQLQNLMQNSLATQQLGLSRDQLNWQKSRPESVGGGVFTHGGEWFGVTPPAEASTQIVTDPATGQPTIRQLPPSGPSVQRVQGIGPRRPVATLPAPNASGIAPTGGVQPAGNPAPAPAVYPTTQLLSRPLSRADAMTQSQMQGAGIRDVNSTLADLAAAELRAKQEADLRARRQSQSYTRPTLAQPLR